ncbi:MAG: murein biosynthesis integral membrane protein MurJ [Actinobacteria bacterium]|nr:murein biosynthesis integral membrane protein MurJ [Actinomycetota bacterium]
MSPGAAGSFVRHSAVMSVGTTLSRATGFLRVSAMAYALGVAESRLADAYQVANTTPNIIYELALGGILSSVFVPVFVEWLQTRGREAAWHTAQAVMTFALLFLGLVMVAGMIGSGLIVRLYTVQVAGPEREAMQALASFFLLLFMPQIVFYGLGAVATGLLNAHRRFSVPMFAPILNNLVVAATFFVFAALPGPAEPTPSGITTAQRYVLAVGTTLGVAAMTLALWPSLRKLGFRLRWTLDLRDAGLRRIGRLAGWAFTYVLINQVGFLVVIVFAGEVQGGVAAYTAAFILFQLPHAIFAVSIMTALLPSLSGFWAEGDRAAFRSQLAQGIRATAFIVVPASFGYLALAVPIVRVLLQHGVAQETSTTLVAGVLVAFSAGLFSFSAFQLFLRAFYAMQDTRTPALIKACTVGLNIALVLVLFPRLRVPGLALAHAIAYTAAALVAGAILRRRLGGLEGRRLMASLARVAFAGCATGAAAYLASRWVESALGAEGLGAQLLQVGAALGAGGAAFLGTSALLRIEELSVVRRLVGARFARSRDGS